ncbi:sigma intracellular receptor 2-like [Coffea eugenioides]|uniref:sigma intracellular receptor 2-like n=1 Tax=Coffea eugenioides TaxID=49369 RepID=UPI000F6152E0|nr:sigma intracellular receptor 2-like [Coffea eugenioides]
MGAPLRLIDSALFIYFLIIAIAVPLIDGQTILPIDLYPKFLIELKSWFFKQIDHYLVFEMPYFYVGIAWFELLFQWPGALMCVYGIAAGKSWFGTTSLIYGSSFLTSLAAILAELIGSKRASDKLIRFYYPFLGFAVLSFARGLLRYSGTSASIGKTAVLNKKKKA